MRAGVHDRRKMDAMKDHSPGSIDAVIERYMRDVDRSLLRRDLALSEPARIEQLQELARFAQELRRAGAECATPAA